MYKNIYAKTFALVGLMTLLLSGRVAVTRTLGAADTEQQAIALAAQSPAFVKLLATQPGWVAHGYDTQNSFGIWHVQFFSKTGDDLGWANLSLTHHRVYALSASAIQLEPSEVQRQSADSAVRRFTADNAIVRELIGTLASDEGQLDYVSDGNYWTLSLTRGTDNLAVAVKFQDALPFVFHSPTLLSIDFPDVIAYDAWQKAQQAQAITLAFSQPQVAAAVRAQDGWVSSAAPSGSKNWLVTFKVGDHILATAIVNLTAAQVMSFTVNGTVGG